jgi:hypothetical protein
VKVRKLSSTDAFVVVDFPDAPAFGVVRRARKVLESSATDLARTATYGFGAFGIERGGASAGINAEGDAVPAAIAAFVSELLPDVADGRLHLEAAKGVEPDDLAELSQASTLDAMTGSAELLNVGIAAATAWAVGGDLKGKTLAIEGRGDAPAGLADALAEAGATVVDVWGAEEKPWLVWGAKVDAILAGSKPGVLTHQGVGFVTAKAIVPWGPIPFTTKALAQSMRPGGIRLLPDFVTTAGAWLGGFVEGDHDGAKRAVVNRIIDVLTQSAAHPDGVLLGACYQAEAFIESWQAGRKPFGRPLAA